jgi:hypothetical protein
MNSGNADSWDQIGMIKICISFTSDELTAIIADLSNGTIFRLNESEPNASIVLIKFKGRKRLNKYGTQADYWITNITRKRLLFELKTMGISQINKDSNKKIIDIC